LQISNIVRGNKTNDTLSFGARRNRGGSALNIQESSVKVNKELEEDSEMQQGKAKSRRTSPASSPQEHSAKSFQSEQRKM
jgi:hypothetical protein